MTWIIAVGVSLSALYAALCRRLWRVKEGALDWDSLDKLLMVAIGVPTTVGTVAILVLLLGMGEQLTSIQEDLDEGLTAIELAITADIDDVEERATALGERVATLEGRVAEAALPGLESLLPATKSLIVVIETETEFPGGFPAALGLGFDGDRVSSVRIKTMHAGEIISALPDPDTVFFADRYVLILEDDDGTQSMYGGLSGLSLYLQRVIRKGDGLESLVGLRMNAGQVVGYSDRGSDPWVRIGLKLPDGTDVDPLSVRGYIISEHVDRRR